MTRLDERFRELGNQIDMMKNDLHRGRNEIQDKIHLYFKTKWK